MENPVNQNPSPSDGSYDTNASSTENAAPTFGSWLSNNIGPLLAMIALIGLIWYRGLNVVDIFKVMVGLTLVILVHELGHFLAAKWCDVHVEMFSIGFGQPLPGCQFKYGETTYKLGWIPLGGFVKMIGEGDNADSEEAEEDPRSFKNKSVGQRMLIISAGVIMNIFLAIACFMVAYSHGIEEKPPVIGWVDVGSPSWKEGIHSEALIKQIGDLTHPMFDDVRPIVMGSDKGEQIKFVIEDTPGSDPREVMLEPYRDSEALFPVVGVGPSDRLTLMKSKRPNFKPYRVGSPVSKTDVPFLPGDRIIATTDPDQADPTVLKPLPPDKRPGGEGQYDFFEFHRRMVIMQHRAVVVEVERTDGSKATITVQPAYHKSFGVRMQMGRVVAVQKGSPAAEATVVSPANAKKGIQPKETDLDGSGDKLIELEVKQGNKIIRFTAQPSKETIEGVEVRLLDPLRLPFDLNQWAEQEKQNRQVKITVLRPSGHSEDRVVLETMWNADARFYRELQTTPNSPLSIPELGLAYYVESVVDAVEPGSIAEQAGIQKGDIFKEVRGRFTNEKGEVEKLKWQEFKTHQFGYVYTQLQSLEPGEFDLRIQRGNDATIEVTLNPQADTTWPLVDRGFYFQMDARLNKAQDLYETIVLGLHRTTRTVKVIYQNLYAMVFARVSPWTMSGPLTIASVSYSIAGENIWQFILFIGMINVNLAVVNFLPIPVLDGGHMVFLIYEWIRGKPAPETVQYAALWIGLGLILSLMMFVIFLDVSRLFF